MVPPDDDRRRDLAGPDQLVERQPGLRPLAVAEPADAGRQALERHALLGERGSSARSARRPGTARGSARSVRRMSAGSPRQRGPAERAPALAELGPDERRHEARVVEGVGDARLLRHRPQVVAVVEDDRAGALEREHRPDVGGHRAGRAADVLVGLVLAQRARRRRARSRRARSPTSASCADVWSVTTSNRSPAFAQAGSISAALPTRAIETASPVGGGRGPGDSASAGIVGQPIDVADLEASLRPRRVDLDRQADALVHRHRERLGAAHPAQPRREHDPPAQRPAEVLARELREGLVRALEDPLGPDVDPGARGHLAVHHQPGPLELPEVRPSSPTSRRGSSWRCRTRGAHSCVRSTPTGLPDLDEQGLVVGEARAARGRSRRRPPRTRAARPVPP